MGYPPPDTEEVEKIPADVLKPLWFAQWELVAIACTWDVLQDIFGAEDSSNLLSRASNYGFREIQDALIEKCILGLARLMDREGEGARRTLSLQGLHRAMQDQGHDALAASVCRSLSEEDADGRSLKEMRNKVLAHNDWGTGVGMVEHPEVKFRYIQSRIECWQELVNEVRAYFGVKRFCYELTMGADASGILESLRVLKQFRELRKQLWLMEMPDAELRQKMMAIRPR